MARSGPFFHNQSPTLRPVQTGQDPTGVVTGQLNPTDPDSSVLTITVTRNPVDGAVAVSADGSYTYTPNASAAAAGTVDSFGVAVSDTGSGLHFHGFAGVLNALSFGLLGRSGHTTTATVPVTVVPVGPPNNPPSATVRVDDPDPITGVVTGAVVGIDPDGDPLTYSGPTNTTKGSVVVTATGTFTFTPTVTARQNAAAPDATDAERSDTFDVTVSDNRGGSAPATVVVAISPAEEPAAAGQLLPADLSFEGFFRVPTGQLGVGQYADLAYGGAAMGSRVVDGERHFFFTGHRYANDPLIELVAPETLGGDPASAPVASLFRYWGDIYGGRKVTSEQPDGSQPNENWTEGLLWDEVNQRLLWSYGNWYAAAHVDNPVLGATTLNPDGTVTVQGPWRTSSDSQQTRSFAVFLSPAVSAAAGGANLGLGGKLQSINAGASWGPSLNAITAPTDEPTDSPLGAQVVISHPITPTSQRTPRIPDYEVARNPDGTPDTAGTQPPVDGVGFWTELDETTGAVFVHTGSGERTALVYSGGQASGLIWYGPDLEYGVADGRGHIGTGNHSQAYRPVLWFVSQDDVVAAAEGGLAANQVNPYATIDLMAQFPELDFLQGLSAGQPVFAEDEGRLYVPFAGGVIDGLEPYPIVAVFSIAEV